MNRMAKMAGLTAFIFFLAKGMLWFVLGSALWTSCR